MNTILAAIVSALDLADNLMQFLGDKVKSGDVTPEEQAAVKARYEQFRDNFDAAFEKPEWKIEP